MKTTVPQRVVDRIMARIVRTPDGCWNWPGAKRAGGYGHVGWHDETKTPRNESTHRALYKHFNGEVPEGFDLDHLCRNRSCCNPEHLEAVTRRENLLRGKTTPARRAAVTHCPSGHGYTPENTRVDKKGRRICKECCRTRNRSISKEKKREYNARARLAARERSQAA